MSYCRTDDSFDTHPKILKLGSDQRRWTWLRVLLYTTRYGSSEVPAGIDETIPKATPKFLAECAALGLLDTENDGTMRVHNWEEYNGIIAENRERWKTNKRKQRGQPLGQNGDIPGTDEDDSRAYASAIDSPSLPLTNSSLSLRHGESENDEEDQEHARHRAWQARARQDDVRSPSAFARAGIASGGWPDAYQPAAADPRPVNMPPKDQAGRIAGLIRNGVISERFELDEELARSGLSDGEAGSLVAQLDLVRQLDETKEEEA